MVFFLFIFTAGYLEYNQTICFRKDWMADGQSFAFLKLLYGVEP